MTKKIWKGSKLIIIFILTVIVSGSTLTYLSITNISNYRELLEKKISEEERELAKRFTSDFQIKLDSLTILFSDYLQLHPTENIQRLKKLESVNGLINYMAIDSNGSFIVPYFINNEPYIKDLKPNKVYKQRLRSAENNEFIKKDFKGAKMLYLETLKVAVTKSDSAHVYNSLGRLYVQMNLQQKAFDTYQRILRDFSSTSNSSGFPYVYFSMIKLLNGKDPSNILQLQKLVLLFLTGLANGIIPLNDSSSELLDSIEEWRVNNINSEMNEVFKELIDRNKNSLLLINNYKIPIENLLKITNDEFTKDHPIDYLSIKPTSHSTDELMLFYKHQPISLGFVIGLQPLFKAVLQNQEMNKLKFDYNVKLIEKKENNHFLNSNLVTSTEFSNFFEDGLIQVSLKNENIIDESVFKRKITYGIGLFLFLGTMVLGLYLLIQDVNREKRMTQLRADFVSNVTHELKTPLTSINMFAEAMNMRQDNLDSKQKKYTTIIVKESEKLKRMINNILEFSKKENNELSYKLKRSNLTDIVNSTIKEMNYFLEINKIDVHLNIAPDIYANIYPEGIKQALSNLISNAIKYSSKNKKLNIQLFKKEKEIFIEVEDFGIGIKKDQQDRIFEKFYRVNSNDNETVSGTGLGLTVAKDIIEEQHGKLLVESTFGTGSKFTIVFSLKDHYYGKKKTHSTG